MTAHYVRHQQTARALRIELIAKPSFVSLAQYERKMHAFTKSIGEDIHDFWTTLAGQKLNKSREKYIKSIELRVTKKRNVTLYMSGAGYWIETGKQFDMRPGFLNSKHIQFGQPRLPRELAKEIAEFNKGKGKPAFRGPTRWMIVPLDLPEGRKPVLFREDAPMGKWIWNKKNNPGQNLAPKVLAEAREIIKRRYEEYVKETVGAT